jgi:hypothetical protein
MIKIVIVNLTCKRPVLYEVRDVLRVRVHHPHVPCIDASVLSSRRMRWSLARWIKRVDLEF